MQIIRCIEAVKYEQVYDLALLSYRQLDTAEMVKFIERSNKILSNENFLAKASEAKVEEERRKQKVNQETYEALVKKYEEMEKLGK